MLDILLSSSYLLTILFCSVLFGFGVTLLTLHAYDCRVFDRHGRQIPGPTTNLWGKNLNTVLSAARKKKEVSKALKDVLLNEIGDGNVVAFNNIYGQYTIIAAHPEMVKAVLSGHHIKYPKTKTFNRLKFFLGEGLMTSGGIKWQSHRHMINPGFQAESLRHMVDAFDKHVRRLIAHWKHNIKRVNISSSKVGVHSIRVDLNNDINSLVMSTLCHAGFGYDFQKNKEDREAMADAFEIIISELQQRLHDPYDWWYLLFPQRRATLQAATNFMGPFIDKIITERIALYGKGLHNKVIRTANILKSPSSDEADEERSREKDLLDLLIRCSEGLSDDNKLSDTDLRDHLYSFLAGGYEPTVSSILWTIYELCLNPHVQARCQEEVDSVLISNGIHQNFITYEDINRLSYLVQVLKESMRLHPVIGTLSRQCQTDCTVGEYKLKAGATVMVSTYAVHRHPEFWHQPNTFLPDRFSRENIRNTIRHPYQYVPFSAGPRGCVGQRFALMQLLTVLASLLSTFSFSLTDEDMQNIREEEDMTLQPKNFHVTVSLRTFLYQ